MMALERRDRLSSKAAIALPQCWRRRLLPSSLIRRPRRGRATPPAHAGRRGVPAAPGRQRHRDHARRPRLRAVPAARRRRRRHQEGDLTHDISHGRKPRLATRRRDRCSRPESLGVARRYLGAHVARLGGGGHRGRRRIDSGRGATEGGAEGGLTVGAEVLRHRFWKLKQSKRRTATEYAFFEHLGMIGGLIMTGIASNHSGHLVSGHGRAVPGHDGRGLYCCYEDSHVEQTDSRQTLRALTQIASTDVKSKPKIVCQLLSCVAGHVFGRCGIS